MSSKASPQITVVMPVHNALPFLSHSIESILAQTYSDFEFIILDDGSTDGSVELLREWAKRDPRIQLHENTERLGLSGSSNAVVAKARAPIIARMDGDDVAHPDRLRRQWQVLQSNSDIVAVGALCNGINASGEVVRPRDRWRLVRKSVYIPFPHGSAMFRRSAFEAVGGYDESVVRAEDQDLFTRMTAQGRVMTLPDLLYSYRYHTSNSTLFNSTREVGENHSDNGHTLAAFYMLGAMRLWAGEPPMLLKLLLAERSIQWTPKALMILASAVWGHVSPPTLRAFLRLSIHARDTLAGLHVKDGRPYEWHSE
jgi:glycosyltransferase involved in cell wall biosynthesis